eukprot:PhF_6_TR26631/c0_g1_i1/m.38538
MTSMSEAELQALYQWVDEIPLSRPKRNIARDFSDGVLVAEVLKFFFPKLIEIHNYSSAHSLDQKMYNWRTLNVKAFRKLNFEVDEHDINDIVNVVPGAIERFLRALQTKVTQILQRKKVIESDHSQQPQQPPQSGYRPPLTNNNNTPRVARQPEPTMDVALLQEKEETIQSLRETIVILNDKVRKLEDLLRIKDNKIQALQDRISAPPARGMR